MVKTSYIGKNAEEAVAAELVKRGHKILAKNWRRPQCEVDIISTVGRTVFFTEVKYRASAQQGEGFEYVTSSKQRQMKFAARSWLAETDWSGDAILQAASVSGPNYDQIDIVEV